MPARRFPPSWSINELEACFVVIDSAGQKLAYVYFEDEPGRRSAAKLLRSAPAPRTLSHSLSGNKPLIHRSSQRAEKHLLANDVADGTSPGHEDVQ